MKSLIAVLALLVATSANAQGLDPKHLTFGQPRIQEVESEAYSFIQPFEKVETNFEDCNGVDGIGVNSEDAISLDEANIFLDVIINMGQKIWNIVEAGRPVVNIRTDMANALPQGLFCWAHLSGWTPTQSKVYRVTYENLYGIEVVDFAFRVVYTTGGNLNGKGKYITNTTVIPAMLNVAWGYTFNALTEVPTVFNSGTKEDPVAGMQLNIKWQINTVLLHNEQTEVFYVGGDGALKHLE